MAHYGPNRVNRGGYGLSLWRLKQESGMGATMEVRKRREGKKKKATSSSESGEDPHVSKSAAPPEDRVRKSTDTRGLKSKVGGKEESGSQE